MNRITAILLLFCLALTAGCRQEKARIRNWQDPDGRFQINIPEGWCETAHGPRGFYFRFQAPDADNGLYAAIKIETGEAPEHFTDREVIRAFEASLGAEYSNIEVIEQREIKSGERKGRLLSVRCLIGKARMRVMRAVFIHDVEYYVVTCTGLEKHFARHSAAFLKTCKSLHIET